MNKIFLNWNDYFKLCDQLTEQIKDKGFTDIIAISRGGLIPAQYIAYKLNIKKIHSFGVSSYKGTKQESFSIYQTIDENFQDKDKILIIDDIADSGKTLQFCLDFFSMKFFYAGIVNIGALHYKPEKSIVKPDYYSQTVDNTDWIVYPYDC